jgi:hypothetical protein
MPKFVVSIKDPFGLGLKIKKGGFEFEFKLNQVHLQLIHCNYIMENGRLHSTGYCDTRGVTTTCPGPSLVGEGGGMGRQVVKSGLPTSIIMRKSEDVDCSWIYFFRLMAPPLLPGVVGPYLVSSV